MLVTKNCEDLNNNTISTQNDILSLPFFFLHEARIGSFPHLPMHPHTHSKGYTIGHYVPWGRQQWDVNAKSNDQEVEVCEPGKDL